MNNKNAKGYPDPTAAAALAETSNKENPGQWVYVIEKSMSKVKIGVTTNLAFRIRTLESLGGFKTLRIETFGPFQNGNKVESEAHKKLKPHRIVGEWFCIDFDNAVSIVSNIAKEIGNSNPSKPSQPPDFAELLDVLYPQTFEHTKFEQALTDSDFKVIKDENGTLWLEHEEYGLLCFDLFKALMMTNLSLGQNETAQKRIKRGLGI